jgi:hypothetical protein
LTDQTTQASPPCANTPDRGRRLSSSGRRRRPRRRRRCCSSWCTPSSPPLASGWPRRQRRTRPWAASARHLGSSRRSSGLGAAAFQPSRAAATRARARMRVRRGLANWRGARRCGGIAACGRCCQARQVGEGSDGQGFEDAAAFSSGWSEARSSCLPAVPCPWCCKGLFRRCSVLRTVADACSRSGHAAPTFSHPQPATAVSRPGQQWEGWRPPAGRQRQHHPALMLTAAAARRRPWLEQPRGTNAAGNLGTRQLLGPEPRGRLQRLGDTAARGRPRRRKPRDGPGRPRPGGLASLLRPRPAGGPGAARAARAGAAAAGVPGGRCQRPRPASVPGGVCGGPGRLCGGRGARQSRRRRRRRRAGARAGGGAHASALPPVPHVAGWRRRRRGGRRRVPPGAGCGGAVAVRIVASPGSYIDALRLAYMAPSLPWGTHVHYCWQHCPV